MINIEKAIQTIATLEKIEENPQNALGELNHADPELFFSMSYSNQKSASNFILSELKKKSAFDRCGLIWDCRKLKVSIPLPLPDAKWKYSAGDCVLIINPFTKTYQKVYDFYQFEKILHAKYSYEKVELDATFKDIVPFTYKKKWQLFLSLRNKNISSRLKILLLRRKMVEEIVQNEKNRIKGINDFNLKLYRKKLDEQKNLRRIVPEHLNFVRIKQKEISEYLNALGYKEIIRE